MNETPFLNYHHLRYFWHVAREGGLRQAAAKLHVSQPSLSAQIRELEDALGHRLFRREGRSNVLTDAGRIALRYADEIFNLGGELTATLAQGQNSRLLRLHVGITDSVPKLVAERILAPVFAVHQRVRLVCQEGKPSDLLAHLGAHRLDIVLSDEPASSSHQGLVFSQLLGESGVTFCAEAALAKRLARGFPKSLDGAPALLPGSTTALRRSIEHWFRQQKVNPEVVGEFEDAALLKVMASAGRGFLAVPTSVFPDAAERYQLCRIGESKTCRDRLYAITAERHITHPAIATIIDGSRTLFEAKPRSRA